MAGMIAMRFTQTAARSRSMMLMLTTVEHVIIIAQVVGHAIVEHALNAQQVRSIAMESAWTLKQIPITVELVVITAPAGGHAITENALNALQAKRIVMVMENA
jgi:phosphotransacetylase